MADEKEPESPDPHFEPVVNLPPVQIKTLEEDEDELIKLRAKLFRYDRNAEPPEWKERGTGDVKVLRHRDNGTCRVLMRRDKTHKICANHYVLPHMELKPNCGSERAWVWSTFADFADEEAKTELLAIRFANAENALKFKTKFDEAKEIMEEKVKGAKVVTISKEDNDKEPSIQNKECDTEKKEMTSSDSTEKVADKLSELTVKETIKKSPENDKESETKTKVNGDVGDGD